MGYMQKPEDSQWTDDQWKAIVSSGQDILVAAAAGSGKTAVLVERIIKLISRADQPVDVDRLLVVTFTNASAHEMRNRIGEALERSLKENPDSLHLRRQLSLLNRASISTLHSFCLDVIRTYYYKIELDPSFRIANDIEIDLLMEEVLDDLFEEQYGMEENEQFFDLIDRFSGDRDDLEVQALIRKLYHFSRANPFPNQWLEKITSMYQVDSNTEIDVLPFYPYLKNNLTLTLNGVKDILLQALEVTKLPQGPAPREKNIEEDLRQVERLITANETSWQYLYEEMQAISYTRAATCRVDSGQYDKNLLDKWTKLRNQAKKQIEAIKEELFSRKPENFLKDMAAMKPVMETLIQLVKEFSIRFQAVKQDKGLVDFADLEHYCLQILYEQDSNYRIIPSDAAISYQEQFVEVLVDEYQDTNLVQEMILKLVAKDSEEQGNLFMVGDVKQSIYRFRLAEPFLFLNKYKGFSAGTAKGLKIDLSKNFRSRAEVLDATNFLFKQIMGETVGEINYDVEAELKLGAEYPESNKMGTELLIVNKEKADEEEDTNPDTLEDDIAEFDQAELETVQLEARLVAKKMKQLVEERFQIFDRKLNSTRRITYKDIVILLRSMPWAPQIMEEFKQQGIPVYAELSTGYFEATEVAIMLSLLRIIDNPYQDIHLVSVLRSPIVGLEPNELATLRIHHKHGLYFETLTSFLDNKPKGEEKLYQKLHHFITKLEQWRTFARQEALPDLIWKLYRETQFFDFVGGMPGGKQRQANLSALYDRARQFESTSLRGLFKFLRFVDRMQDRGDDLGAARAIGEQEDVVRIMTIHKSKGLEFPVVFVCGLAKHFNMKDLYRPFLFDKDLGFASRYVNPKLRISYPMLPQITLKQKMKLDLIAEEMRVLYVALTRAKEKLILVGTLNNAKTSFEKWEKQFLNQTWQLPDYEKFNAKSYLDWIGPSLVRHRAYKTLSETEIPSDLIQTDIYHHPSKWHFEVIDRKELEKMESEVLEVEQALLEAIKANKEVKLHSSYKDIIQERLNWHYPHPFAAIKRSKQTVSEIKRQQEYIDEHSDTSFLKKTNTLIGTRPKFMQEKSITSAERGTATHMVMQHIPLNENISVEFIENLVAKMVYNELLTSEQANVIDIHSIVQFFATDLGKRLCQAHMVNREVPFSLGLPACEAYPDWDSTNQEIVLIQGIIDCLFEDEAGMVLLDYKTDTITGKFKDVDSAKSVIEKRYRLQIDLYTKALEHIWKKPITEKYLYLFDGGYIVKM